ncbi:hypothetical protein ACH4D4_28960 [Streptomyces pristinaespiralis]|uniref:hypothetical protein n=1 Tax=Streptomyces pristinaespiralis TaxID=38300 RepID=UPI003793B788
MPDLRADGVATGGAGALVGGDLERAPGAGMRAKLKRLVNRGILAEAERGLFTLTPPAPTTLETNSS